MGFNCDRVMHKPRRERAKKTAPMALDVLVLAAARPKEDLKTEWFGDTTPLTTVVNYTKWIKELHDKVTIRFQQSSNEDLASTDNKKWITGSKTKALGCTNKFGDDLRRLWATRGPCTIFLGTAFGDERWSDGECACSILHEMSHLALFTDDVKARFDVGQQEKDMEAYGADLCLELKRMSAANALRNAENWGYYLASYRKHLKGSHENGRRRKWSPRQTAFLTAEECMKLRGTRTPKGAHLLE